MWTIAVDRGLRVARDADGVEDRAMMPDWVSPLGLCEHLVVGAVLTTVLALLGTPPVAILVAVLALALAHEQAEETLDFRHWADFVRQDSPPWNGVLDVLAFLVAPLVWLAIR